jgi:SAM-dependent methyltransferase
MKIDAPENNYEDPNDFYTLEESKRYDNNSGMKKTQTILTNDCLEIYYSKRKNSKKTEILDVGCGTGFSIEYLKNLGYYNVVGIEPSQEMLKYCKEKKFFAYLGGFEDLLKIKEIENKTFDLILSISALQWVIANKQEMEIKNIIKKIGKALLLKLKEKGIVVIQFYPRSENIFEIVKNSFSRAGFKVSEYIKNLGNSKKQKYFIILEK